MLSKSERAIIRQLLQSPEGKALALVANLLITKIQDESTVRETEWETLKSTIAKEAKVEGIRALLNELFNQANDAP